MAEKEAVAAVFGRINAVAMLERSILSVTAVDEADRVLACATFNDSPPAPGVAANPSWESTISSLAEAGIRPVDSLFLTAFAVADNVEPSSTLKELLSTVFTAVPRVRQCLVSGANPSALSSLGLSSAFTAAVNAGNDSFGSQLSFVCCQRNTILPPALIRPAVAEDYDDLMPIFEQQSDKLSSRFGTFYLNELVEHQTPTCRSLSMELDGHAVGFVNLRTGDAIEQLTQDFDLSLFPDLRSETAVSIALFAIAEQHGPRALELLPHIFEAFPERQYCVLTMPHNVSEFALLQDFLRITPQAQHYPPHELYIYHKQSLSQDIGVRPLQAQDLEEIKALIASLSAADTILADVQACLAQSADVVEEDKIFSFVTTYCGVIAGLAVTRSGRADALRMRANYDVEDFILYGQHPAREHINLHHFVVNPILHRWQKFVLGEVMRQSQASCLYTRVYPSTAQQSSSTAAYTLSPVVDALLPVRPRFQPAYPLEVLQTNVPAERLRDLGPSFALLFMTRKLLLEQKITCNQRLVVVGEADTALACLEQLALRPHLRCHNITLVARGGMPVGHATDGAPQDHALANSLAYSRTELQRLGLDTWVSVVNSAVECIDRESRVLRLQSGLLLPYDYLLLAADREHGQVADWTGSVGDQPPTGVFAPSTQAQVRQAFAYLSQKILSQAEALDSEAATVTVYGDTLDAYCMLQALQDLGFTGARLRQIRPLQTSASRQETLPERLREHVEAALLAAGVQIVNGDLIRCNFDGAAQQTPATLRSITVSPAAEGPSVTLPSAALLLMAGRQIPSWLFQVVDSCYLVYDDGLVIDNMLQTNDARILASGACTRYSRRYAAHSLGQQGVSWREAGTVLAQQVLGIIDPLAGGRPGQASAMDLPVFAQPWVVHARLPGQQDYLRVQRPQDDVRRQALRGMDARAEVEPRLVLTTGGDRSLEAGAHFFEIQIDERHLVCGLECLTKTGVLPARDFVRLYGLHQCYLNNLVSRYNEGLISDFFTYFRAAWAVAIFNDRFQIFTGDLLQNIKDSPHINQTAMHSMLETFGKLTVQQVNLPADAVADTEELRSQIKVVLESMRKEAQKPEIEKQMKDRLMDFLTFNAYSLPMYARPGLW